MNQTGTNITHMSVTAAPQYLDTTNIIPNNKLVKTGGLIIDGIEGLVDGEDFLRGGNNHTVNHLKDDDDDEDEDDDEYDEEDDQ
jgi:hypothetical protein